jgi:DNA invertase Pin-like site-specific DNA recombinase
MGVGFVGLIRSRAGGSEPPVSARRADRRELNRMLGKLARGDVVTVARIDRLVRSTFDLFGIVERIVDARAQFRSLAEPGADTGTSTGRLMLDVLGGLADVERDLICTRVAEGRNRAKAEGKHIGCPLPPQPVTAERGHQTPRAGRDVAGIGRQLRPQHIHHAPHNARCLTQSANGRHDRYQRGNP